MSRLLLVALAGAGIWYLWRVVGRRSREVVDALRRAEATVAKSKPVELEKDPETGVYRPAKHAE